MKKLLGITGITLLFSLLFLFTFTTLSFSASQGVNFKDIAVVNTSPPADFNVSIRLNKNVGSVYQPGEEVKVYITANKDCYIRVWDIGTSGHVTLLYPYRRGQTDFIKAGTTLVIPGPDAKYIVTGPEGTEYIQVIASLTPMKGMPVPTGNKMFPTVSKNPKKFTKDIVIQTNQIPHDKWISSSVWFTIKRPVTIGTLSITTTPLGADIRVDNVDYGKCTQTLRIPVPQGTHIVTAYLAGYAPVTKVVQVQGGQELPLMLTLIPPKGYVTIVPLNNETIGARIFVDGYDKGIMDTPNKTIELSAKKLHEIVLIKEGYYISSQKVFLNPGETKSIAIKMERVF